MNEEKIKKTFSESERKIMKEEVIRALEEESEKKTISSRDEVKKIVGTVALEKAEKKENTRDEPDGKNISPSPIKAQYRDIANKAAKGENVVLRIQKRGVNKKEGGVKVELVHYKKELTIYKILTMIFGFSFAVFLALFFFFPQIMSKMREYFFR